MAGQSASWPASQSKVLSSSSQRQRKPKWSNKQIIPERLPGPRLSPRPETEISKVRMLNFSEWQKITTDQWILDTVEKGYKIEFEVLPCGGLAANEIVFSQDKAKLIDLEIEKLLAKGAIEIVEPINGQFISNIFVVPKKDGSLRPVINLKKLNTFVKYQHFKQESLSFALDLIQRNDYLTSIDLTDAYFSSRIDSDFCKFLRFTWRGFLYEFKVLCFG